MFDFLIVGAGFAGCVLADRLARSSRASVLLIDQRQHIGGNAYDEHNDAGLLVHRYGPHIFHTNSEDIYHYLGRFTEWRPYQHRVLASVEGQLVPIPVNLDTINQLTGQQLTGAQVTAYLASVAEPVELPRTSENVITSKVGRQLYNDLFRGYTRKQWGRDPSELGPEVTSRIPIRVNRDDRYFTDRYQVMPRHGYHRMFARMIDHPGIKLMLNTSYEEVRELIPARYLIWTGPLDQLLDYRLGRLPYRTVEFHHETIPVEQLQPVGTINYPNDYEWTRRTEFKHLTGQQHAQTSICYEVPREAGEGDEPYYPIPSPGNRALASSYKDLAASLPCTYLVGRLATYQYLNMDQVVGQALKTWRTIEGKEDQGE